MEENRNKTQRPVADEIKTPPQPVPGNDATELKSDDVKNAHASGLGAMGRHEEEEPGNEGILKKD